MPIRKNSRRAAVLGAALSALMSCHAAFAQENTPQSAAPPSASPPSASPRFPFVIPWDDATENATSVAFLNPAPLGDQHRIRVENGRFVDQTGRRVRFLGTNFGAGANFPTKEDAPKIAARLRKLGFNAVRLHHMDAAWSNPSIFGRDRDAYTLPNRDIDAESLDRLDYLVYQLGQNGIYVNLNLHVSWAPSAALGFPDADKLPELGKQTAYFEKGSLEHQRNFARQFLTHRNPYTERTWADDPIVAMIELNNEDTIVGDAFTGKLLNLPPFYRDQLGAKWNEFLRERYDSTDALKRAWTNGEELGANLLQNARFENQSENWTLEQQSGEISLQIEDVKGATPQNGPKGRAARLNVKEKGEFDWHHQFHQPNLALEEGEIYTVRFWAKANAPRSLPVSAGLTEAPWSNIGLSSAASLSTQWQQFSFTLSVNGSRANKNRLSFILGGQTGEIWLADLEIRKGFALELNANQTLETNTIPLARGANSPQGRDVVAFLMDVELDYAEGMRDFIQKELGAKGLVTCSQAWLGGLGGVLRESRMDWVDMHAYWQHPEFPNKPWDVTDWRIPNTAMTRESGGGTLPHLAQHRVEGKPFTVTEYNHAAPNDFAAETLPMALAFAAQQDWDGLFLFDYNGGSANWNMNRIRGFFDADSDPNKMAFAPAAALFFASGANPQIPSAPHRATLVVPRESVVPELARTGLSNFWASNMPRLWEEAGFTRRDWLDARVSVQFVEGSGQIRLERDLRPAANSDALEWRTDTQSDAVFTVDAPAAKAVVGFVADKWLALDGLTAKFGPATRDFLALTLTARDGEPIDRSKSLLVTALANAENSNMGWNPERTSVSNKWGNGPVLAEGVSADLQLQTTGREVEVFALDSSGARVKPVPSKLENGVLSFSLSPEFRTVWYEIVTR